MAPASADPHYFPVNASSSFLHGPRQPWVPPAPGPVNNQREDIPPQNTGVAEPGRMQDLRRVDMTHQGIGPNPAYVFPDVTVGHAQGIHAPMDQVHNPVDYVPPHVAPGLVQAAFPRPFVHRDLTPDPTQAGAENLRQLARHYLHHPDAHVSMVSMEAGAAGRIRVAVIFETPDF